MSELVAQKNEDALEKRIILIKKLCKLSASKKNVLLCNIFFRNGNDGKSSDPWKTDTKPFRRASRKKNKYK